jgi:hypothetical protein
MPDVCNCRYCNEGPEALDDLDPIEFKFHDTETINAVTETGKAILREQLKQLRNIIGPDPECKICQGEGIADSGGTYPWGEPAYVECPCIGRFDDVK